MSGEHDNQRSSHRGSHTGHQQGIGAQQEPYRLRAVGHSLGGASLLIYAVTRSMKGKPTHLSRLILLTPAGFQQNYPKARLIVSTESRAIAFCCLLLWTLTWAAVYGRIATVKPHDNLHDVCSLVCLMTCCQQGKLLVRPRWYLLQAAAPFLWVLPPLVWALHWIRPGVGAACYIPSSLLRYVTFKLTVDMQQIPALNELVRAGIRVLLNGDSSQWDRAMQMPHYNTRSMPSISFHTGMHLIQVMPLLSLATSKVLRCCGLALACIPF